MQVARTAVAREPLRAQARPQSVPLVKTAAKMSSKEKAKAPPRNPRLPSAIEAAMAVASLKATARDVHGAPAKKRENKMKKKIQAAKAAAMRAVWEECTQKYPRE